MDRQVLINEATTEDCDKLYELALEASYGELWDGLATEGRESLLHSLRSGPRTWLENREAWVLCARAGPDIHGYIAVQKSGHLTHLFVAPAFQKQGLGRKLFQTITSQACPKLSGLTVNAALPAIGFYESLGFIAQGTVTSHRGLNFLPMRFDCDTGSIV